MKNYTVYAVVGTHVVRIEDFEKLQQENKKLVEALRLLAFPEAKLEHEDVERFSRQVLKEIGEE